MTLQIPRLPDGNDEDVANARQIAAGPELYEALMIASFYAIRRNIIPDDKLRIVQAALAKARGE